MNKYPRRQCLGRTLKEIEESDLDFLLVPLSRLTRNQLHIEFGGTSIPKEQVQWNKEQLSGLTTRRGSAF